MSDKGSNPASNDGQVNAVLSGRRGFLQMVGVTGAATTLGLPIAAAAFGAQAAQTPASASMAAAAAGNERGMPIKLTINGKVHNLQVDPRTTLLDTLREHIHLTGTKKGCDHGQCGACTVMIDGRRVNSCLTLAAMADGSEVTTIEGLGEPGKLSPMQQAFLEHDGYQCGYCTSGQIVSATALLKEPSGTSDADVKEAMSGNICRCGAYTNIVAAIQQVRNA